MATRFYLPSTGTPAVTPTITTGWDGIAGATFFPTDVVKTDTATAAGAPRAKNSTTANTNRLDRTFISTQQLAAQTIPAGTISAVIRALESVATADAWLQIMVRVVSADGATQRGVLYAGSTATAEVTTAGADAQEYGTASSTRIKNAIATSSVVAQAGDRIQIEVGARFNGTATADTFTHRYGDPVASADFALTAGLTTDLCPWVELSPTLTWQTSATPQTVAPDVVGTAATTLAPTAAPGPVGVTPGVASTAATTLAPTAAPGPLGVAPGVAGTAATALAPAAAPGPVGVTPGVASTAATALAPSVAAAGVTVSPPVVGTAATTLAPSAAPGAFGVTPGVAGTAASVASPAVTGTLTVSPPLVTADGSLFAPSVTPGTLIVTPDTAGDAAVALTPRIKGDGRVFVDQGEGVWDPRVPEKWNGSAWVPATTRVIVDPAELPSYRP